MLSAEGLRCEETRAVTVRVSEVASPKVVLPSTERFPESWFVPLVLVELKTPTTCKSPSASIRAFSVPLTAIPSKTLLVPADGGFKYTDP